MKTIREPGFYWCRIDKLLLFTMSTRVSLLKISSLFENLFLEIQTYSCIHRYIKTGKGNSPNSQPPLVPIASKEKKLRRSPEFSPILDDCTTCFKHYHGKYVSIYLPLQKMICDRMMTIWWYHGFDLDQNPGYPSSLEIPPKRPK